jgi:hypothetical protein
MDPKRAIKIYHNDNTKLHFITTVFTVHDAMLVKDKMRALKKSKLVFKSVNNKTLMCFDHMGRLDKVSRYNRGTFRGQ